jgi:hypothetical protein
MVMTHLKIIRQFQFISLSIDPLQGQIPDEYRNSQTL